MKKLNMVLNLICYKFKKFTVCHKSKDELHRYWMHSWNGSNLPEHYLRPRGGNHRSQFLVNLIKQYADNNYHILEIGCNVGRNLNHLFLAGFDKLTGIEINKDAIALMKKHYPQMAKKARIINRAIEDVIESFEENKFDIVFTMAVLEHIHPESEFIFSEMVKITNNYLITIEDEKTISWRHFPRNYKEIFEALDMEQIYEFNCREIEGLGSSFLQEFL